MKGIEMMLANLLGMKPEEMRAQFEQGLNLMKNGANAAEKMQRDIDAIKQHLGITDKPIEQELIEHGGRTNGGDCSNGNRIQL